jgi:hypothetical protein
MTRAVTRDNHYRFGRKAAVPALGRRAAAAELIEDREQGTTSSSQLLDHLEVFAMEVTVIGFHPRPKLAALLEKNTLGPLHAQDELAHELTIARDQVPDALAASPHDFIVSRSV